jgi:hypothetical protein
MGKSGNSTARSSNACGIDRSEGFADTIVQLFCIRTSGVMPYGSRRIARLPLRDTCGD